MTLRKIKNEVRDAGGRATDEAILKQSVDLHDSLIKLISINELKKAKSLLESAYQKDKQVDSSLFQEIDHFTKLFEQKKDSLYYIEQSIGLYRGLNNILNTNLDYVSVTSCGPWIPYLMHMTYTIEKRNTRDSIEICLLPNIGTDQQIISFTQKNGIHFYNLTNGQEVPFSIKHIGHVTILKAPITKGEYKIEGYIILKAQDREGELKCRVLEKIII